MNSSLLNSPTPANQTTTLGRIVANVVDMQQQLATQFEKIQTSLESLRLEQRTTAQNMREDLRRTDDRAQKQVDEMRQQHSKEVERLMDVIKTLLAKQEAPRAAEPAPRPTPQQMYSAAQSPASFFGTPNDAQMRQAYMMQEQMRQMQIQQQQAAMNAAATMPPGAPSGGITAGAPAGYVTPKPTPSTLQTQLLTPPMPTVGTVKLPISPEMKPKPVEVKKDVVLPATTTAPVATPFTKPAVAPSPLAAATTTPAKSIFGQATTAPSTSIFAPKTPVVEKKEEKKTLAKAEDDDDHVEEFEPQVDFKPVIPLPDKVEVVTGEEDEDVVFEERCKLYRFADTKEWKERGLGNIRVLKDPKTGVHRVVMRREQVHKLCANFKLTKGMTISKMGKNEKAVVWHCFDFAEEEQTHEQLSAKFSAVEQADAFIKAFNAGVASAADATPVKKEEKKADKKEEKKEDKKEEKPAAGFGAQFKIKEGEWECTGCYIRHAGTIATCPCCGTNKDGSQGEKDIFSKPATTAPATGSKFSFGFSKPADSTASPAAAPKFSFGLGNKKDEVTAVEKAPAATTTADKPKFSFASAAATAAKEETPTATPTKSIFGAAAATPKFSFGTTSSPSTSIFGGSKPAADGKPAAGTFSFAPKKEETSATSSPVSFSFKSATATTANEKSSLFGGASTTSTPQTKTDSPRIFGSGLGGSSTGGNAFAQAAANATTSIFSDEACKKAQEQFASQKKSLFGGAKKEDTTAAEGSGDEAEEEYEPNVDFKPVIPLPDLVEVKTGEENETAVFTHRCKLYRFDPDNKEWKERGTGDIKILKNPETGKHRVVMRREQVHKLCANFAIVPSINIAQRNNQRNVYQWVCMDYAENTDGAMETFSVRFKNDETAKEFHDCFVKAQQA